MSALTREQDHVYRQLLQNLDSRQVQTVGGLAGTGKTVLVCALAKALPTFASCAYTGKAAHVLRQRGLAAKTIHSLIYNPIPKEDGTAVFELRDTVDFRGFLVDEASLISRGLHRDLLSFGKPVIFVGDHGQLPPIGEDINLMANPDHILETLHRNAGIIANFAHHLRGGKPALEFPFKRSDELQVLKKTPEDLLTEVDQILCAFNKTRVQKNDLIRKRLKRRGLLTVGDRIICLRNNHQLGLFNGQQGTVTRIYNDAKDRPIAIDFHSDGQTYDHVPFDRHQLGKQYYDFSFEPSAPVPFDYGYAITCHKSMGSEYDSVMVFEQECTRDGWDHKRWAYTAATRAKQKLWWVDSRTPAWVRAKACCRASRGARSASYTGVPRDFPRTDKG
jgi:exodeoxyribonuclease-5